jgi:Putative motility protein
MDMMSMVMQAGNTQTEVATAIMKSNADAAKSAAQTLLGAGPSPQADAGPGIGGNLDVTA